LIKKEGAGQSLFPGTESGWRLKRGYLFTEIHRFFLAMKNTKPAYIIETQRLGLRSWSDADQTSFAEMNGDPQVMQFFPRTLSPQESLESLRRILLHFEKNKFGLLVVEHKESGQFMGFTGFQIPGFESFFTPAVEIGWRFKKQYWGQGFATEAARACLDYGFQTLEMKKIVSFTAAENKPSENLMKRIGMSYVTSFDHPLMERSSPLCRHVLYQIQKEATSF
jgi:ribosomal-protein-alanine N-acetyltransferase